MAYKLKKVLSASQSYGRGMDNTRTPARWEFVMDGEVIGTLMASSAGMFERPRWEFRSEKIKNVPIAYSRRELIESILARIKEGK